MAGLEKNRQRQVVAGNRNSQSSPKADAGENAEIGEGQLSGAHPQRQPPATSGTRDDPFERQQRGSGRSRKLNLLSKGTSAGIIRSKSCQPPLARTVIVEKHDNPPIRRLMRFGMYVVAAIVLSAALFYPLSYLFGAFFAYTSGILLSPV